MTLSADALSLVDGTAVNVNAGTLNSNTTNALQNLANVTVAGGAVVNLGTSETFGALNGAGTVNLNASILTVGSTNNLSSTFAGVLADTSGGGLTKAGTGTLFLNGANTYNGPTNVSAGDLRGTGSISSSTVTTSTPGTASVWPGLATSGGGVPSGGETFTVTGLDLSGAGKLKIALNT